MNEPEGQMEGRMRIGELAPSVRVVVPDAPRIATLHSTGRRVTLDVEQVWRPMCFTPPGTLTEADLLGIAADDIRRQADAAADAETRRAGPPDEGGTAGGGDAGGGLNLVFDIAASVPAAADDALARIEHFFSKQFDDDITVTVNISFDGSLPGGVLGAASTSFTHISWNASRSGLRTGMDESDRIQKYLPRGSTIPVRYNGNSPFVTNENRIFWTIANFNSTVGFISGDAGSLRFNENITWDYDPDDGVVGFSFVDVVIHEVGHALGFGSGVDFRNHDMEALDIYRFQRTDGVGGTDYNPDRYSEFRVRPRLCDKNLPNNDVISDIISQQYKMEDGFPYQASHFYDKNPPIGIMDPILGQGQTFAPKFFSPADKRMLDAIGWDR